ncbi:MAG: DUF411 domain-containing protein [Acidobacteriaceae bacterium]|jgi:hypothetical protein|nr:DUF411 domain-containing protein [Acidobacteriaceae bacterium]
MRTFLLAVAVILSGGIWLQAQAPKSSKPQMVVYKSPECGCCLNWIAHMKANGFDVKTVDVDDIDKVKRTYGVPPSAASCHTALVGNFVVEGHVPADAVSRMLREKPAIAGIAVPGMPIGAPGMEMPGGQKDPFAIVAFDKSGKTTIYERR